MKGHAMKDYRVEFSGFRKYPNTAFSDCRESQVVNFKAVSDNGARLRLQKEKDKWSKSFKQLQIDRFDEVRRINLVM